MILSPGRTDAARCCSPGIRLADAGSGDVHAIGFAVLDHFGVAARDATPARSRGGGHGADFGFQNLGGQAGFENIADHQRLRRGRRKPRDR